MKNTLFACLIAGLLFAGCKKSQDVDVAAFEDGIEQIRKDLHNTGLQVVVVKNNAIVYSKAFGYKNVATGEPLTEDNLFRIASISKSFTTTSLLQLAEQGKVSLSADVSELAGFPIRNPRYPDTPITLEMLLSHTSSLNDNEGYFTLDVVNPDVNPDWALCYNDYAPGEGYEYCNLNLNLAGSFLEKISGERFDRYVYNHVLKPLGLYGGYCIDSLDRSLLASLYEETEDVNGVEGDPFGKFVCVDDEAYAPRSERIQNYRFGYDTPVFSPTGGMKLSARSLAQYMLVHINYGTSPSGVKIISESSARSMQTPRSEDEHYGLSLWQTDRYSPGVTLVGHTGGAYGMRSAMFFNPVEKYGFVVISGGAYEMPEDVAASSNNADPSGSAADEGNILTRCLRLMYRTWI